MLQLKRYRKQRQSVAETDDATEDESDNSNDTPQSSWLRTALSIADVTESQVTYLDFVRDVE